MLSWIMPRSAYWCIYLMISATPCMILCDLWSMLQPVCLCMFYKICNTRMLKWYLYHISTLSLFVCYLCTDTDTDTDSETGTDSSCTHIETNTFPYVLLQWLTTFLMFSCKAYRHRMIYIYVYISKDRKLSFHATLSLFIIIYATLIPLICYL